MKDKFRMRKIIATKALQYDTIENFLLVHRFAATESLSSMHKKLRGSTIE
jgi:hypothetical protein